MIQFCGLSKFNIAPRTKTKSYKNNAGDKVDIQYKNGQISASYINGELYKEYKRKLPCKMPEHTFSDNSKIPYKHLWNVDERLKDSVTYIKNHQTGRRDIIIRNDNNNIKNEAKYFCHLAKDPNGPIEKHIVKLNDAEEFEFKSVEEAEEYFLQEYGIKANFKNLFMAHIAKQAVDTLIPYNYQGKGKRLFEGLEITTEPMKNGLAAAHSDINNKLFKKTGEECFDYLSSHKNPKNLLLNTKIIINDYDAWDYECVDDNYKSGLLNEYFYKDSLIHELIHILHHLNASSIVVFDTVFDDTLTKKEQKIMKEVSKYAATNRCEFVAEYAVGRMDGKTYSKEADNLYKKWRGPDLF